MDTCYVFVVPNDESPIWDSSSEDIPHATILYLPAAIAEHAVQLISEVHVKPFDAKVDGRGELGSDKADVLFLDAPQLTEIREALLNDPLIREAFDSIEQFPEYTPHLTLGYPETPAKTDYTEEYIWFDRIAVGWDKEDGTPDGVSVVLKNEPTYDEYDDFTIDPLPIYGVLCPEGVKTGDGRRFSEGALTWDVPPLAFRWQEKDAPGHDNSVTTGKIERIWRENNEVRFEGSLLLTEDAGRMTELVATGALRGLSVDLDDAVLEERPDLEQYEVVKGRIRSAAAAPIQAYVDAWFKIGSWNGNV